MRNVKIRRCVFLCRNGIRNSRKRISHSAQMSRWAWKWRTTSRWCWSGTTGRCWCWTRRRDRSTSWISLLLIHEQDKWNLLYFILTISNLISHFDIFVIILFSFIKIDFEVHVKNSDYLLFSQIQHACSKNVYRT